MITHNNPIYLRISRNNLPEITGVPPNPIAPAVLCEGADVGLVACGVMARKTLLASDELARHGLSARVINVPCLKPLPDEVLHSAGSGSQRDHRIQCRGTQNRRASS